MPSGRMLYVAAEMADGTTPWNAKLAIVKSDEEQGLVFGWLYQTTDDKGAKVVDHSGDVTSIEELEDAGYKYAENGGAGTDMHERVCPACEQVCAIDAVRKNRCGACGKSLAGAAPASVARLVEIVCLTGEKKAAMGIPATFLVEGTWVGLRIDRTTTKGREAWAGVKTGRLSMLSLGGSWTRRPIRGAA